MGDRHFAMVSEWMTRGNINEFIKANRDVNLFELVSCPPLLAAPDVHNSSDSSKMSLEG